MSEHCSSRVRLDCEVLGSDWIVEDCPKQVNVEYDVEVEWREYGIKDISVSLTKVEPFDVLIAVMAEGQEREVEMTVTIDPAKLKQDAMRGDGVWVESLDVWLKPPQDWWPKSSPSPGFTVDYEASELNIVK